jgi:hypothetical protein
MSEMADSNIYHVRVTCWPVKRLLIVAVVARIFSVALAFSVMALAQAHPDHKKPPDVVPEFMKERIIAHREDLSVVRVGSQLFLLTPAGQRTPLYTDKNTYCSVAASFLNNDHIYLQTCSKGAFVSDLNGAVLYRMHNFKYSDIAPNKSGTRFAVFERGRSAWHEFGQGTYDKLRLLVYSTADGKRLFEHKWRQAADEIVGREKIELSDDGSTLSFHSQKGTQVFSVPGSR